MSVYVCDRSLGMSKKYLFESSSTSSSSSSGSSSSSSSSSSRSGSIVAAAVSVLQAWVKRFKQEAGASFTPCKIHMPELAVVLRYLNALVVILAAIPSTIFTRR